MPPFYALAFSMTDDTISPGESRRWFQELLRRRFLSISFTATVVDGRFRNVQRRAGCIGRGDVVLGSGADIRPLAMTALWGP